MKKKYEKKYVINSNDLTKTTVSLLEANQTQQTIIINFFERSNLSDYSICICPLSPLLGTPESVIQILCEFPQAEILENKKLYVVFSDVESGPALDENDQLVIFKLPNFPIALKNNEAIGLLKKDAEDTWKLVDWVIPIVDEVIPIEVLKRASVLIKYEYAGKQDDLQFMRKKEKVSSPLLDNSKIDSIYMYKPKIWLYSFLFIISFIEISSLIQSIENIWVTIFEAIVLITKNIFIGNTIYHFIVFDKKKIKKTVVKLSISIIAFAISLMLFSYDIITATLLIVIVVIVFSLIVLKRELNNITV
jgi:uncharacterized protein YrzB (UPF0473 family)